MTLPFRAAVERVDGDVLVVNVVGELDQATVPELEGTLDEAIGTGPAGLVVDLSDCGFIDSSGLATIVAARERLTSENGRRFGICCADSQVRRLLEITGLDTALGVANSRAEALEALAAQR
jgi:anti-sigma B factor antagonist